MSVKKKKVKAWVGIVDDNIHKTNEKDSCYTILAIFHSKRTAKLAYEYVVPCTITYEVKDERK